MSKAIRQFFDALNREETKFVPRLAGDRLGIDLRCALNELNWGHYITTRAHDLTYDDVENYYILQLGVGRLIYLALTSRPSFDVPVVLFPRDPDLSKTVLDNAWSLGVIQHGRRVAQRVAMGVGQIAVSERGEFSIELPAKLVNDAGHENEVLERLTLEFRQRFTSLMRTEPGQRLGGEVRQKLAELVYPWRTHFIGYDADPLLDEYFFGLAHHQIQMEEGFDSFHYAVKFGGVSYQTYVLALTFLLADYIRHEAFAEALVEKDASIRLENVLTITSDIDAFATDLREAVNYFGSAYESFEPIGAEQARAVFNVLSCGRHSTDLVAAPGSPTPLIVQCSDQGFIHCPAGARGEPVRFLLEALRHHFPQDYDNNQRSREGALQRAVKRMLGESLADLEFRENLKAKANDKLLTDIDLVVIEKTTGIVLLCQLKHQDPYGSNLHAERTRGERLVEQTRQWLVAVDAWLRQVGTDGLRRLLRPSDALPEMHVHRLVIAKHFAHQLKNVSSHQGTLYATWAQLVLAATATGPNGVPRSLTDLLDRLREIPALQSTYEHQPEVQTKWSVGDLTFVTHQVG